MRQIILTLTIALAAATQAEIPYFTPEEEEAVCDFWRLQYDHLRAHGEYAPFDGLVTGDGPDYYEPAWTNALGRFQVFTYNLNSDNYRYRGLDLYSKETGANKIAFQLSPAGFYWLSLGIYPNNQGFSGELDCARSTADAAEDRARVLDDLVGLREAVWLYRVHNGSFPDTLDPIFAYGRYVNWSGNVRRWGHQYSYASDGLSFTVAAWPMRSETPQTHAFYLDQTGTIREATEKGVGPDDPPVQDALPERPASLGNYVANERAALDVLCEIHHAEEAYKLETGNYTTAFADIQREPSPPYFNRDMSITYDGYDFVLGGRSQNYSANANASEYGVAGERGFFLDASGFVRARLGRDAATDSPIIGTVCNIDESFQPTGQSLPGPARMDVNGDYQLSMSELLQLVQHYNVGAYHCDPAADDGYTAGPGPHDCPPLEVDNAPQDWAIALPELLRAIQLYASGVYFPCPGSEDGLCVPTEPVV